MVAGRWCVFSSRNLLVDCMGGSTTDSVSRIAVAPPDRLRVSGCKQRERPSRYYSKPWRSARPGDKGSTGSPGAIAVRVSGKRTHIQADAAERIEDRSDRREVARRRRRELGAVAVVCGSIGSGAWRSASIPDSHCGLYARDCRRTKPVCGRPPLKVVDELNRGNEVRADSHTRGLR
jgi:hypothetical protein